MTSNQDLALIQHNETTTSQAPSATAMSIDADNSNDQHFTVTLVEERDLQAHHETPPAVRHVSPLQSFIDSGTSLFDPLVHFLQSLAEGVHGSPPEPLAAPQSRDHAKRLAYLA
jgi:hypothetical protein